MTDPNQELTPRERALLAELPREAEPPRALEDATVAALLARGLLGRRGSNRPRLLAAAAAAVLLFLGGVALGRRQAPAGPEGTGSQFVLLLYEDGGYRAAPPGEEIARVREYRTWAGERAARGELVAGEKLRDGPDLVIAPDGMVRTDSPPAGARRLAGFFIVRAADRGRALEIARSCPHVRYGGSIVVREIEPT